MQVAKPIDIEDALRVDLAAILTGYRFFCPPIPPNLTAGDVLITSVGGGRVSGTSHDYDISIDCYAENDANAVLMADAVQGALVSLPLRQTSTQFSNANANLPYSNHDPRAPQLSRQTFRATVICPGEKLSI